MNSRFSKGNVGGELLVFGVNVGGELLVFGVNVGGEPLAFGGKLGGELLGFRRGMWEVNSWSSEGKRGWIV